MDLNRQAPERDGKWMGDVRIILPLTEFTSMANAVE
jgi:hypothetical protein